MRPSLRQRLIDAERRYNLRMSLHAWRARWRARCDGLLWLFVAMFVFAFLFTHAILRVCMP